MKIRLFCAAGMSTSLLVQKMKKHADDQGIDVDIDAHAISEAEDLLEGVNVVLLGPQVGFQVDRMKELCEPKGIKVGVIPMIDYGMMNGEKVVKFALSL
ncbi:PTS sugar transporter subunit IIB [Clostridium botulinum]|uniref:Cytochrome C biogenesis protein CcmE n=1 Tax=Clostridium botulinum C/D str. DC5 TaxID=1443128 RepID=A0A0A0IFZ2_CLOBO|nr:PTS sugar transporter subunit IIB [Clostridium botulinum]KEI00179.1 cytochrome C biogenesis protein CcmE [Clostridium botulinum C/D str. BKT75002]KEI09337.1 cytochrome C biogenesis protein CcmE [Clostridium botulinum C/D str. BKT2873]KGM94655.1 cytochrome C biogenesis protein CcmE [Clostridium botulinum D str. CCUG 7971]KGM99902.1 cytochrome C biogenesis protein CcmE [Clostridium botulinum C/D str. DC5]KOC49393.1 cytochrome C biogenesis protein CcmE [Clostridium botulinum]